jgi:hypothetical protein
MTEYLVVELVVRLAALRKVDFGLGNFVKVVPNSDLVVVLGADSVDLGDFVRIAPNLNFVAARIVLTDSAVLVAESAVLVVDFVLIEPSVLDLAAEIDFVVVQIVFAGLDY